MNKETGGDMKIYLLNILSLWIVVFVLLCLGVKVHTNSMERDNYVLKSVINIQNSIKINQTAIIDLYARMGIRQSK